MTTTLSLAESVHARYERLIVARELFPLCDACGRDLSNDRLARLIYIVARNRFRCPDCQPSVAA